ncbi:carbonic anhydrase [Kordiimonas marina]|uniref:carbonic anhydrase n=1 Tax=Kordiimonas marina TaxID=2872312 RepID=UPI001FF2DA74|nr:carbonic anhydrase family protein [Kordiimonas marina]MCJ9428294.1 carbonic anhydrase family protein [Kordiimonas marina]
MFGKFSLAFLAGVMAVSTAASADTSWSYSGSNGQKAWGSLSPAYATCDGGAMQSPINIEGTEPAILHQLKTDYQVAPLVLKNNRHTIVMSYPSGSWLDVGNKRYELKSFHFHTPAEHTVVGLKFPMEIHFVHQAKDGSLAVVAVLVREGKENLAAEEIWPNLPIEPDQAIDLPNIKINARDLMPNNKTYYRYMGSLTTPPCTEGVNWYVLKTPIEFSAKQINAIKSIMGENARNQQPRNNRIILDAQPH